MSLYGVGLNVQVQKINTDFRLYVSKSKGGLSLSKLRTIFNQFDVDKSGKLNLAEFEQGLNKFGFFLKKVDYQCLLKAYDTNKDGLISYKEFIAGIKQPLNQKRLEVVEQVFNSIDTDKKNAVPPAAIAEKLSAAQNSGKLTGSFVNSDPHQVAQQFEVNQDGLVSKDNFISYFEDLGQGFSSDNHFVGNVAQSWGVEGIEKALFLTLRQYKNSLWSGMRTKLTLIDSVAMLFKYNDESRKGYMDMDDFYRFVIGNLANANDDNFPALFKFIDSNNSGTIELAELEAFYKNGPY